MKSVKGTKTEVNLLTAFAGESQARNRYTYFASKAKEEGFVQMQLVSKRLPTRKRNTRSASLSSSKGEWPRSPRNSPPASSAQLGRILPRLRQVKITSGRKCILVLQKWRAKRDLMRLRRSSNPSRWPRSSMRSGMRHLWRTSMQIASLRGINLWCGDALTAATSSKVPSRPKSARHVRTRRDISNFWLRIGKGGMQ